MDRETSSKLPLVLKEVDNNLEFHACLYVQLVSIHCNEKYSTHPPCVGSFQFYMPDCYLS